MSNEQNPGQDTAEKQTAEQVMEMEMEAAEETVDQESLADDWAAAMAEQITEEEEAETTGDSASAADSQFESAGDQVFKPLDSGASKGSGVRELDMVMDIPVKLNVELGRTRITIKQLLELTEGSVVELDGLAGDPMDILINGYLVAQGEVVVVDDKYGIRITEIITPSERIHKLNR